MGVSLGRRAFLAGGAAVAGASLLRVAGRLADVLGGFRPPPGFA